MSEEQLKAFIAKAKDDQSIQEKLKAAKTPDDVVGIAKEHDHEFTADTLKISVSQELTDDELEAVAGGYLDINEAKSLVYGLGGAGVTCST